MVKLYLTQQARISSQRHPSTSTLSGIPRRWVSASVGTASWWLVPRDSGSSERNQEKTGNPPSFDQEGLVLAGLAWPGMQVKAVPEKYKVCTLVA